MITTIVSWHNCDILLYNCWALVFSRTLLKICDRWISYHKILLRYVKFVLYFVLYRTGISFLKASSWNDSPVHWVFFSHDVFIRSYSQTTYVLPVLEIAITYILIYRTEIQFTSTIISNDKSSPHILYRYHEIPHCSVRNGAEDTVISMSSMMLPYLATKKKTLTLFYKAIQT